MKRFIKKLKTILGILGVLLSLCLIFLLRENLYSIEKKLSFYELESYRDYSINLLDIDKTVSYTDTYNALITLRDFMLPCTLVPVAILINGTYVEPFEGLFSRNVPLKLKEKNIDSSEALVTFKILTLEIMKNQKNRDLEKGCTSATMINSLKKLRNDSNQELREKANKMIRDDIDEAKKVIKSIENQKEINVKKVIYSLRVFQEASDLLNTEEKKDIETYLDKINYNMKFKVKRGTGFHRSYKSYDYTIKKIVDEKNKVIETFKKSGKDE